MRLLLVEDTADVAEAIAASFARRGDAVDSVGTVDDAIGMLGGQRLRGGHPRHKPARRRGNRGPEVAAAAAAAHARADADRAAGGRGAGGGARHRRGRLPDQAFDLRELQARVRALARRSGPDRGGIIEFGRLALDPAGRVASCDGAPLSLTRREFSLLEALMANRARVMPKERLFDRIFSMDDEEIGLNAIETYVARLRRKLEGIGRGDPHPPRARLPARAGRLSEGLFDGAPRRHLSGP